MKKTFLMLNIVLCLSVFSYSTAQERTFAPTSYVNPFIGAVGEGHTFPGAALPHGMVKLGPDCNLKISNSGYDGKGKICGFSHVHVSGTGGPPKYGNVLVMATSGALNVTDYASERANEQASPGYFSVDYTSYGVQAEFSVTHSVGFHKYKFTKAGSSHILIDLGSFLDWGIKHEWNQQFVGSEVQIISDKEIQGYTRIRKGWGNGDAYTVYFYALFDTPNDLSGTWKSGRIHENSKSESESMEPVGAYFTYHAKKGQVVKLKVGISFVGVGKAKENLYREIDHWDFNQTKKEADQVWNNALGKIQIDTDNKDKKTIFYTALYHAMLQPTRRTGENPLWKSNKPCYDDFFCIWDTYRATHPLLTLIEEQNQVDMVNSLLDIYENDGYMPDARSGNSTGSTQGGSNSDVLISDAFVKGLKGIDYEQALKAMIKNAEVPPGDNERKEGRGGIPDYNTIGYVSTEYERAGSRTMEYAFDDYCIATVAKGLGKNDLSEKYLNRSNNWKNIWYPDVEDDGAHGFIMPRKRDGSWQLNWNLHLPEGWDGWLYEGNSWEYSFYVPHDVSTLIRFCGGPQLFEQRLDTFFTKKSQTFHPWLNDYYNVNNEPAFLTPMLYHYVGKPYKSARLIRRIIAENYNTGVEGLPGNDDAGSMSAWYIFHSMGFFPIAGTDVYLITAPLNNRSEITVANGNKLVIETKGLTDKNIYIQSATLNGKPYQKSWFCHGDIINGAKFEFIMGDKPSSWAISGDLPPSMSDLILEK